MIVKLLLFFIINHTEINPLGNQGLKITFSIDRFKTEDLSFANAVWLNKFGEPNLPSTIYKIGIPQEGHLEVRIVENREERIKNIDVKPVVPLAIYEQPVPEKVEIYGEIYKQNNFFPKELVEVSSPGYFRDIYTVDVRLNPIRYNPVTKELVISQKIIINIRFIGKPSARPIVDKSFEEIYKRVIINYWQCKGWRREPKTDSRNPFTGGVWFKIEVAEEGIYRIGYNEIKRVNLDPKQFDPKTMRIYTAPFDLLPRSVVAPFGDSLVEVPCYVEGEDDHVFDKDDYLIFYGFPASHFLPDSEIGWYENGYARNNVYWFTFGNKEGKRMEKVDAAWNGTTPTTLIKEILHIEQDLWNPTRSGINWYWKDASPGTGLEGAASVNIEHPKANGEAKLTLGIYDSIGGTKPCWIKFFLNNNLFFSETLDLSNNFDYPPLYLTGYASVSGDSSNLGITITRLSGVTGKLIVYFNGIDIEYPRITDVNQPFHAFFMSPDIYTIKCLNVNSKPFILDITELRSPKMLSHLTVQDKDLLFSSKSDSFQILYFSQLSLTKSAHLIPTNPGRLRNPDPGCEYLFITHKKFYNGLMPLFQYRSKDFRIKFVTVDEIFDNFSFGKYDPLAIKHLLYYTTNNWTTIPKYVLLVGDATYDYKNNLVKDDPPNYVPMYESGTCLIGNPGIPPNYIYEGEYVNFFGDEAMILGRITARTSQELRNYIDKLITYETKDIDGMWCKKIILAGDDEWADNYEWEGITHVSSCELVAGFIPDTLYDFIKVYMVSYPPFVYPTKKPNAQKDFIKALNRGALAGCFVGHGNAHQLAHEGLFYDTSIPFIKNGRRHYFFYFASCTVGRFDDSDYECIGEQLARIKEGAIGTMAATAGTDGGSNQVIGQILFSLITNPDTNLTMGECSFIARSYNWNLHYLLIGEPAASFRKVKNSMALSATPDSLRPLEKLSITSSQKPYYLQASIRDTTHIELIDASTAEKISSHIYRWVQSGPNSYVPFDYKIAGKEIYQGYWDYDTAKIIVPKVLTTHLPVIKLSNFKNYQSGGLDSIRVYGNALPSPDQIGPEITFYDGARRLKDGDWVNREFILTGKLTDESGVNLLNSKEDARGFYLYVNHDLQNKIDLRDYFLYEQNSYTSGAFNAEISLPEPTDTITVNVADNNFNQTTKKIILNAEVYGQIAIENFLIYPNPVRNKNGIWFTFNLTSTGLVTLKIFTISGRLIKMMDNIPCHAGYNQRFWDGTDQFKDEISNGVYLVKALVESENGKDEVFEKFIVAR